MAIVFQNFYQNSLSVILDQSWISTDKDVFGIEIYIPMIYEKIPISVKNWKLVFSSNRVSYAASRKNL